MSSTAKLSFKTDWVDAEGISGPELAATWASLEIRAGDSIITRVLDTRAKTVRDFVYVPLYPFAEWVVTNWWFLTHEISNPTKDVDPQFRRRHAIGGNREGYAYPDLQVLPYGALTCLAWTRGPSPWTGIEFLDWGELWVDSSEFRDTCRDLIDRVIRRLLSLDVEGTLLQEEWEAIQGADRDEIEFCEAAAGLGWDPYDLGDEERSLVLELGRTLSGAVLEEGIAAFNARSLMTECSAIAGAIGRAKANALRWEPVASMDHELALAAPTPWEAGYELARDVRRALGLDGQPLPSMARIAAAIGAEPASLDELTAPVDFEAAALGGWRDHPKRRSLSGFRVSRVLERREQAVSLLPRPRRSVRIAGHRHAAHQSALRTATAQPRLRRRVPRAIVEPETERVSPGPGWR